MQVLEQRLITVSSASRIAAGRIDVPLLGLAHRWVVMSSSRCACFAEAFVESPSEPASQPAVFNVVKAIKLDGFISSFLSEAIRLGLLKRKLSARAVLMASLCYRLDSASIPFNVICNCTLSSLTKMSCRGQLSIIAFIPEDWPKERNTWSVMSTKNRDPNAAREKRMLAWRDRVFDRQLRDDGQLQNPASVWGPNYLPSILAVPGEAPPGSSPIAFTSTRLQRTMHALSIAEAVHLALAIYNPRVWDIHENHMLGPWHTAHPLAAHPVYRDEPWPYTKGTLTIAGSLGRATSHPQVRRQKKNVEETAKRIPQGKSEVSDGPLILPWLGDILLFMNDEQGVPRVIEWDVKSEAGKHAQPWAGNWRDSSDPRRVSQARLRDQVYQTYMNQLGIPIKRVARDLIDPKLGANLIRLCARAGRGLALPETQIEEIGEALSECPRSGEVPADVIRRLAPNPQHMQCAARILDRWVWERRIRVDLWQPILIDQPLVPEKVDVLDHFAELFN